MAKLTKKQRTELESVIANLKKVKAYIQQPNTAICLISRLSSGDGFKNKDGQTLIPVDKQYGSDIVHLASSIQDLEIFCKDHR